MKLYWSINSIPELADLSRENRKEIWKMCCRKTTRQQFWTSFVLMGACIGLGVGLGEFYYGHTGNIIGAVIAGGVCGFIIAQVKIAMVRPHIREYLSSHEKTNQYSL